MSDEALDPGLFAISLSDSEDETQSGAGGAAVATAAAPPRDRTGQTEQEFQTVKETYRAKVENGEVCAKYYLGSSNLRYFFFFA
jgi:hypothetical protein